MSVIIDLSGKKRAVLPWPLRGKLIGMSGELLIIRGDEEDRARYTALRLARQDLEVPPWEGSRRRTDRMPVPCSRTNDSTGWERTVSGFRSTRAAPSSA